MEAVQLTLSPQSEERLRLLCEVAGSNGSLITLGEIVPLLPERATEGEIAAAIRATPTLSSKFNLESGYVTSREEAPPRSAAVLLEATSRERARINLSFAHRFAPLLGSAGMSLISVGGSTSYRSASRSSDLDLFCVTRTATLWIALTKSLLLTRAFRIANPDSPLICLSCIMDEDYAQATFSENQGAHFARDALETVVLLGNATYHHLLEQGRWMGRIYPDLYSMRLSESNAQRPKLSGPQWFETVLNRFLHLTVGSLIRMKSLLLNRRLARRGASEDIFSLLLGEDHLVYESARYVRMRKTYSNTGTGPLQIEGAPSRHSTPSECPAPPHQSTPKFAWEG